VVYFAEETETTFTKSQLKVPVGVKERTGDRPLCYCFGHSVASIKQELHTKGRSDALQDIRGKMNDPACSCEVTNPSGACCLGSVSKGIEIAKQELGRTESVSPPPPPSGSSGRSGEKIAKIGTLVSAVIASSCCWLPLVLLAVGVSGAGIASTLEAYRPIFIVVTFGFLSAAFYFTYRPGRPAVAQAAVGGAADCCARQPAAAEDCCATPGKRRFTMMAMNKVMLWVVTVLAVAFLFFPKYVGVLLGTGGRTVVTTHMNRVVFKVEGMTCEGCAATLEKAIKQVPGVEQVNVSYRDGRATIGVESGAEPPREAVLQAIAAAGYQGSFLEDASEQPADSADKHE
jgi:copper chaperone CopZ